MNLSQLPPGMEPPQVQPTEEGYRLTMSQWLPRTPEALFPFFADAYNLEAITPDILRFKVLTPKPIEMRVGALLEYQLRLRGFPIRWRTEITGWDPPHGFRDEQRRGPYRLWRHTHRFTLENGGSRCDDTIDYAVPGGPLAPMINRLMVQRDVEGIFRYRAIKLHELFGEAVDDTQPTDSTVSAA